MKKLLIAVSLLLTLTAAAQTTSVGHMTLKVSKALTAIVTTGDFVGTYEITLCYQ